MHRELWPLWQPGSILPAFHGLRQVPGCKDDEDPDRDDAIALDLIIDRREQDNIDPVDDHKEPDDPAFNRQSLHHEPTLIRRWLQRDKKVSLSGVPALDGAALRRRATG